MNTCLKLFRPDGNQTSLHRAVRHADVACVKILIDSGSEIDSYDKKGNTPLAIPLKIVRVKDGQEEVKARKYCPLVKILSEKGAKFDAVKVYGNPDKTEEENKRREKRLLEELKTIFENCINGNVNTIKK